MRLLTDSWIVFTRQLRMNLRNPAWLLIGIMNPLLYLFLFGPLLKPLATRFGSQNAYTYFVPGLLVQLGIFGTLFNGFGLVAEWREGVVDAERVTPASRSAMLLGRLGRDLLLLTIQMLILVGLGFVLGMVAPVWGVLYGVVLTLALGATGASFSYALALGTKSEDALAPITNAISLPVLLLSGILLPMALGPSWLRAISDIMPPKHIVDAIRNAFDGTLSGSGALWGAVWAAALLLLAASLAVRAFRRDA